MSKQRRITPPSSLGDPSLDHASTLVQEYTRKLRTSSQKIHDIREKYLTANQRRLKLSSANSSGPSKTPPQEHHLWIETLAGYRSRHDVYAKYLRALIPQARKLAQHVSQLITHGTDQTIVQIELSLRVAELEIAIETAQASASSNLAFQVP